jgi:hypothetical protein
LPSRGSKDYRFSGKQPRREAIIVLEMSHSVARKMVLSYRNKRVKKIKRKFLAKLQILEDIKNKTDLRGINVRGAEIQN